MRGVQERPADFLQILLFGLQGKGPISSLSSHYTEASNFIKLGFFFFLKGMENSLRIIFYLINSIYFIYVFIFVAISPGRRDIEQSKEEESGAGSSLF